MKKLSLITIIAAVVFAFTVFAPVSEANTIPFTDINNSDPEFYNAVVELYADGVVFGKTATKYEPNSRATRGETAEMIVRALGWENESFTNPNFSDVKTTHEYYKSIAILANKKIISGSDGKFRPDGELTRANIAKILTLALELEQSTSTKTPFTDLTKVAAETQRYIATLVDYEITKGATATTFNPNGKMTRKQLTLFIHRGLKNVDDGDFEIIGIE